MVGEPGTPGRRVGELDEEMVYEARAGEVITLGASSWRIEEIGHDRVTVSPAPGVPGKLPFWHGDAVGRPIELGRAIGAFVREVEGDLARGSRGRSASRGPAARAQRPRRVRRGEPRGVPGGGAGGLGRPADRPADRRGALPGRAGRLADRRPHAVRRPGPRPVVASRWRRASPSGWAPRSSTIWSDDGIAIRLPEGELETDPGARGGAAVPGARRGGGSRRRRRRELGPVRVAVPGERGPRPAAAAPPAGHADAALAAAPAGGRPAGRGEPLRQLPDPRRDVSRVPGRRVRPGRPARGPGRRAAPRDRGPLGRDRRTPRRSRARCSSTTSPRTCTTGTRRSPNGAPRR